MIASSSDTTPSSGKEINTAPVLTIRNLSKAFAGTQALKGVDLDVGTAQIHALVGQNGSGKSTLIKVLAGFHEPDPGSQISVRGHALGASDQSRTQDDALRFVHQDLGLILELSAAENFALRGRLRSHSGRLSWSQHEEATQHTLSRLNVSVDVRRPLREVSAIERVGVAIGVALHDWDGRGVLVLDEPTAVLPHHDVDRLLAIVTDMRESGTSVLYVSHRLDEIFWIGDVVSVLRDGERIATHPVQELNKQDLVSLMLGKDFQESQRASTVVQRSSDSVLEATDLTGKQLRGVHVTVERGEILGLAGLPDSGKEELAYTLAGIQGSTTSGIVRFTEHVGSKTSTAANVALVPADRHTEGIISQMSVTENLSLPLLNRLAHWGILSPRREHRMVTDWLNRMQVSVPSAHHNIGALSGGNQQKVIVGRCLALEPSVLVLCEPTAGVDVGARQTIYDFIVEQAKHGLSVVVSSSDEGDLVAMCSRVIVLRKGSIVRELNGEAITEQSLVHAVEGTDEWSTS